MVSSSARSPEPRRPRRPRTTRLRLITPTGEGPGSHLADLPRLASARLSGGSGEAMHGSFGFKHLVTLVMDHEMMLGIDVVHELSRFR